MLAHTDCSTVNLVGHSFGAATMVLAAHRLLELREPSALCYPSTVSFFDPWSFALPDDVLEKDLPLPGVAFVSEGWLTNAELPFVKQLLRSRGSEDFPSFVATGTVHQSFSDSPLFFPGFLTARLGSRGPEENIELTHQTVATVTHAALDLATRHRSFSLSDLQAGLPPTLPIRPFDLQEATKEATKEATAPNQEPEE